MDVEPPPLLVLHAWRSETWGDRWTLLYGQRAVVTRATELEARRYARDNGWVVRREDELA